MNFEQITGLLPEWLNEEFEVIAEKTVQSTEPLKLCLVGPFSTGKSSLLNMLIDQQLLPVAREETTALPTFIEYGETVATQQLGGDGSVEDISLETFCHNTVNAPEGIACTVLRLPLDWLNGLTLMDLPGLGSTSSRNREYTIAQIRLADVILYLLPNRGPSLEDIETLTLIRQYDKRLKIVVSQWDAVEKSVADGERAPDLKLWAEQIAKESGMKMPRLLPVSKYGMGRDELLDFISRAKDDLVMIREKRFAAELLPVVENALGQNRNEQQACHAQSEEAIQHLHNEHIQRKQTLLELKSTLYARQQADRTNLESASGKILEQQRKRLSDRLESRLHSFEEFKDSQKWDAFLHEGSEQLRGIAAETAQQLSELSQQYGKLELPQASIDDLNLRLPQPDQIEPAEFIDLSRLNQLEKLLCERQNNIQEAEQKINQLPVPVEDVSAHEQMIAELRHQNYQLQTMTLPKVVQQIEGSSFGKTLGRMVGEVADIALMFVNPATVATKTAAIVGKGAKVAKVAINTTKVATNIKKGLQTAKAVQVGKKTIPGMKELGMLEMLSLGYWGEKLGSMFDSPPQYHEYTDPEAIAQQQAALYQVNSQISELNRQINRLQDIESERELTGITLQQSRQEQTLIAQQIENLKKQAESRALAAHKEAEERHIELVKQQATRAIHHWQKGFDQQTEPMIELLYSRCKTYWNTHVEQTIALRVEEVDQLSEQMRQAPQEKEARLSILKQQAEKLTTVCTLLGNPPKQ